MKFSSVQLALMPFLFLAFAGINGQQTNNRFIVSVMEHPATNITAASFRCWASVITRRHVVTTANCATVPQGIQLTLLKIWDGANSGTSSSPVSRISTHSDYRAGNLFVANIAVLEISGEFDTNVFPTRSLGVLPNNGSCDLFHVGSINVNPLRYTLAILGPQHCDATLRSAFCSNFDVNSGNQCLAMEGSPVVCTNGNLDGFLINSCTQVNNQFRMNYHSIDEFRGWIEQQVSSAKISAKISIFTLLLLTFVSSYLK